MILYGNVCKLLEVIVVVLYEWIVLLVGVEGLGLMVVVLWISDVWVCILMF